jgi:hypothetical protein
MLMENQSRLSKHTITTQTLLRFEMSTISVRCEPAWCALGNKQTRPVKEDERNHGLMLFFKHIVSKLSSLRWSKVAIVFEIGFDWWRGEGKGGGEGDDGG